MRPNPKRASSPDALAPVIMPESKLSGSVKSFHLSPKGIAWFLLGITLFLLIANIISLYLEVLLPEQSMIRFLSFKYFYFDGEGNIPTYFSALLLLASSIILFLIYKKDRQERVTKNLKFWGSLSIIFLFLSVDEAVQIHEQFIRIMHHLIPDLPALISSAWIIPYGIVVLLIGAYFLKFVLGLPNKTRNLFIISGLTYVLSAIGLELPETYFYDEYGRRHVYLLSTLTLQELLEMISIITFIYTLLDYVACHYKMVLVTIETK